MANRIVFTLVGGTLHSVPESLEMELPQGGTIPASSLEPGNSFMFYGHEVEIDSIETLEE